MPRRKLAALAALAVLVLAGCSQQTEGSPTAGAEQPGTSTSTPSEQPPSTGETEPEPENAGLADLQPCDLVEAGEATGLGLTGGEAKTLGEARVCQWRREGATLNDSFTVSLSLFDSRGLADIVGTNIQSLPKVGNHEASSFVAPGGSCGVSLGVGTESRADSTAVGGDQQQGCQLAASLAALVEPKLP